MGARQGEWQLVGRAGDPVPGDPYEVSVEAKHYDDIAATIRAQAYRLRRMSESEDDLKGHYADGLKDGMRDLADDLDKIYNRFDVVADQLEILHPALVTARTQTMAALNQAIDDKADADKKAEDPDYDPPATDPFAKSAGEKACDTAVSNFDDVADDVARKIKAAANDDMKDSGWDKFKGFVGSIATVLTVIRNIIGVVLVVLAVVALFIPGLGAVILVLMLASLAISVLLAATDNGSWVDVAWDVAGLLTLGIGSGALKMAKLGRSAFLARQGASSGRTAAQAAFSRAAWNGGKGFTGLLSRFRPSVIGQQLSAFKNSFMPIFKRPPFQLPRWDAGSLKEVIKSGFNRGLVEHTRDLRNLRLDFPSFSPGSTLTDIATVANGMNFTVTGVAGYGSGAGLVDTVAGR